MAFPATTVWECRTDGNDANSGGFVTGASGTDFSQQAAAQVAYTDMVIDGADNTKFTSAANPVTAAHVGNVINVTAGTGFTVQRVYIVSQAAGVATCDKSLGTLGSTGGTGNLGGALLTIQTAATASTTDDMATYVRGGTYSITAAITFPARTGSYRTRLIGYSTVRGDLGRPVISVTAAVNGLNPSGGWSIENVEVDGTSTGSVGCLVAGNRVVASNCYIHHCTSVGYGFASRVYCSLVDSEITACVGGISGSADSQSVSGCYIHDNTATGINSTAGMQITNSVISNNTGASSDGIRAGAGFSARSNVVFGNGRDGLQLSNVDSPIGANVTNTVFASNGRYGVNLVTAHTHADFPWIDYNAFYNNTSGARNNINASPHDVTLTEDPFVNAAGNDFRSNNAAGGGALLRNAGFPGALPGLATPLGYADIGVYRHKDPTGAGRGFRRGMG